jgi:hypothetical protein
MFKLCEIQFDLSEVEEQEFYVKNKDQLQGKHYYLATFVVNIIIAPTDQNSDYDLKTRDIIGITILQRLNRTKRERLAYQTKTTEHIKYREMIYGRVILRNLRRYGQLP